MNSPAGVCQSVTEGAPGGLTWRGQIYLSADSGRQHLRVRFLVRSRFWILPNYVARLGERRNDPDKLFILHPTIWTTLEHGSRCAAQAQMLQAAPSLSSAE